MFRCFVLLATLAALAFAAPPTVFEVDATPRGDMSCFVDSLKQELPGTKRVVSGQLRARGVPLEVGCITTSIPIPGRENTLVPEADGSLLLPVLAADKEVTLNLFASRDCPTANIKQCICRGAIKQATCKPTGLAPPRPMTPQEEDAARLLKEKRAAELAAKAAKKAGKTAAVVKKQSNKVLEDLEMTLDDIVMIDEGSQHSSPDLRISDKRIRSQLNHLTFVSMDELARRVRGAAMLTPDDESIRVTPLEDLVAAKLVDLSVSESNLDDASSVTTTDAEEGAKAKEQLLPKDKLGSQSAAALASDKRATAAEKHDLGHFFGAGDFAKNDKGTAPGGSLESLEGGAEQEQEEESEGEVLSSYSAETEDAVAEPEVDLDASHERKISALADIESASREVMDVEPEPVRKAIQPAATEDGESDAFVSSFLDEAETNLLAHASSAVPADEEDDDEEFLSDLDVSPMGDGVDSSHEQNVDDLVNSALRAVELDDESFARKPFTAQKRTKVNAESKLLARTMDDAPGELDMQIPHAVDLESLFAATEADINEEKLDDVVKTPEVHATEEDLASWTYGDF